MADSHTLKTHNTTKLTPNNRWMADPSTLKNTPVTHAPVSPVICSGVALVEVLHRPCLIHFYPPLRSTFAVRETASLGIMGPPRVLPFNPSESIVL